MKLTRHNLVLITLGAAVLVAGCHMPRYAYRARVIDGALPPPPVVGAPFPSPVPVMPDAQAAPVQPAPIQPAPLQPLPETSPPAALPATPQPSIIQPRSALASTGLVLEKVGPAQATVGALVTYTIEVQAASGGARDVVVIDQLTPGLSYTSSTPPAAMAGNQLEWRMGDFGPSERRTIEVAFRAEQAGVFNNCAVARTAEGQTSQDCASTAVLVPGLEVRVAPVGRDTVMVGEPVTFEITVTNRSNLPAAGLVISDRFDPGLTHEAAASPIEKELGPLAGGQSATIGVTFRVTQPGRLCNHVEVRGESGIRGAADGCVTAVTPQSEPSPAAAIPPPTTVAPAQPAARAGLQVKVSGPTAPQQIDAIAEFFIDLANNGETALTNVTVSATFDRSLKPTQATDDYTFEDERLSWTFDALPAGKTRRLQVNCRCLGAAAKACTQVKATSGEGVAAAGEACVEIRGGESKLETEVFSLTNPVAIGSDVSYEIRVTNKGDGPDRNVALLVVVPPQMAVTRVGTFGPRTTYDLDNRGFVRYKPVDEIAAGETLTFRVRARAQLAGEATLEAILKSDGQPQQKTVEHKVTINVKE